MLAKHLLLSLIITAILINGIFIYLAYLSVPDFPSRLETCQCSVTKNNTGTELTYIACCDSICLTDTMDSISKFNSIPSEHECAIIDGILYYDIPKIEYPIMDSFILFLLEIGFGFITILIFEIAILIYYFQCAISIKNFHINNNMIWYIVIAYAILNFLPLQPCILTKPIHDNHMFNVFFYVFINIILTDCLVILVALGVIQYTIIKLQKKYGLSENPTSLINNVNQDEKNNIELKSVA